ncbi:ADP-ribosyltransferase [Providencia rustigianii]|uniref:ADP-ribosyltransferase n=1 Tax=Providencia rustigianii TaxID=158850 RepID=UPI0038B38F4E
MNICCGVLGLPGNVPGTHDGSNTHQIQSMRTSLSEEELLDKLKKHFPLALAIKNIATSSQSVNFLSSAEIVAVQLYSGEAYKPLNRKLRSGQTMTSAEQLLDMILSKALAKSPLNVLTKTYRGSQVKDALGSIAEGKVGMDPAYLSTSRDPNIASEFANENKYSLWSVIFGCSGFDMVAVNKDTIEAEVLYPKDTAMRLLLRHTVQRREYRVLEEASVSVGCGHIPFLVDALDLVN